MEREEREEPEGVLIPQAHLTKRIQFLSVPHRDTFLGIDLFDLAGTSEHSIVHQSLRVSSYRFWSHLQPKNIKNFTSLRRSIQL
ncbi:MAG: hypothetical protein EBS19_13345 [Spirochaetia bacterium]|nr:hypothetical protein [Spirochaetia bacterium]